MSNYTSAPSFDGPSGYPQHWSSSDPSQPGMLPQNYPLPSDFPGSHNEANNMSSFHANSHLPGLGVGAPGPLPPPPFPFMGPLTPSQFVPPFPQIQMPFLGYPPMPMPTAPNQQQQTPSAPIDIQSHSVSKPTSQYDQEEGEVTDRERTGSTHLGNQQRSQAYTSTAMDNHNVSAIPTPVHSKMAAAKHQDAGISEAEEGEASSISCASSRASGSPYNPPMSVTAGSPLPDQASVSALDDHSDRPGQVPASLGTQKPQIHARSETTRAQLRIQAQGALLRLVPHNIRFHDLVNEGINPMVLRQLYEEVGIKVSNPETGAPVDNDQSRTAEPGVNSAGEGPALEGRPHSAPQSAITKPMERKEVIARMLAAKAAKASASPQESVKGPSAVPSPRPYDTDSAMSPESPAKEKEAPIKEKNKAQTELARKRIDELMKKQGLMRSQQKSQVDHVSQELQSRDTSPPSVPSTRVEHPLPERPPLTDATPARLPGLSVAGSSSNAAPEVYVNSLQGLTLDSTPQSRVTQRKRPRASDFDEPTDISEDSSQRAAAKLVIDISDDEFYGDDENDHMDIETPALRTTSSADLPGMVHQNARGGDQDHIRKKDQEIQAMRQKIAELEQRKKAKLAASNTQSPVAQTTFSLDGDSIAMDLQPSIVSPAPPVITQNYNFDGSDPDISQNQRTAPSPPKDLSSMDSDQLEAIRLRFLRKREIESGLPDLDSEIENTAAKLSDMQKDEETLLHSITKGKQGRQRLLEELGDLGLELNGLTLEQVEAAQRKLESRNSSAPLDKASIIPPSANPENGFSVASENLVPANTNLPEETAPPVITGHESSPSDSMGENRAGVDMEGEAPEPYASDSAGSAMDESSGSSSTDSTSDSEDSSEYSDEGPSEGPEAAMDEQADGNASTEHHTSTFPEDEPQSLMGAKSGKDPVFGVQGDERQVSRASSVASEAYEPPEPEPDSGSAVSEYVPAGPGNEEPDMTEPFPSQPQTDESLTGNVQEIGVNLGGTVQNAPEVPINEHKFSPYLSPLRYFKSYRYHPNYCDDVLGGYRSLTYSHNIDAMKYLCPFEVAGGVCNDQSCDSQHFGSMALSDDKILVQMGSLREGKTPEEKDQYITGLKQIINDMRRDKVKDFNTVATEIAAYRRRFLQDPSRVLPL